MRKARCKFYCDSVAKTAIAVEVVKLTARYDATIPEDERFNEATPWGDMTIGVNNPALKGFFVPGMTYYLDVTCAEPVPVKEG